MDDFNGSSRPNHNLKQWWPSWLRHHEAVNLHVFYVDSEESNTDWQDAWEIRLSHNMYPILHKEQGCAVLDVTVKNDK